MKACLSAADMFLDFWPLYWSRLLMTLTRSASEGGSQLVTSLALRVSMGCGNLGRGQYIETRVCLIECSLFAAIMHELSIALSVLDMAEAEAARRGNAAIAAIHIRLGALSGVVKQALASAYDLAREGTSLADCELIVEEVPIVVNCRRCAASAAVSIQAVCCPVCGGSDVDVVSGRELEVSGLEIVT